MNELLQFGATITNLAGIKRVGSDLYMVVLVASVHGPSADR